MNSRNYFLLCVFPTFSRFSNDPQGIKTAKILSLERSCSADRLTPNHGIDALLRNQTLHGGWQFTSTSQEAIVSLSSGVDVYALTPIDIKTVFSIVACSKKDKMCTGI